ncbi:MAG: NYN domain-containing protein [Microcoleaceae cyanobacterium]
MPHHLSQLANNATTIVQTVSEYLYQTLVFLQQQHPEGLKLRYREMPWHQPRYHSTLLQKLTQGLSQAQNQQVLLTKVQAYLKTLLSPEFMASAEYPLLLSKLEQLIYCDSNFTPYSGSIETIQTPQLYLNGGLHSSPGIGILLLDVENIQLDQKAEKFLGEICSYPIQIRVAFANWRSMGKRDIEFHNRGYQLIHVPPGKDSADLKMATVGSSIFVYYPTAKEVFVCSSDKALTHLCNTLQSHGLTVYQVTKKQSDMLVFNSKTGEKKQFSLLETPKIPPIDQLIEQLQNLIIAEQKRIKNPWIKISRVALLYKEKYRLTLSTVVSTHFSDYKASDIFYKNPKCFAVHQPSEKSSTYVTLFSVASQSPQNPLIITPSNSELPTIQSLEDLEKALVTIIQDLLSESTETCVSLSVVGSYFNRQYGQAITHVIKQFLPGGKFTKFIDVCHSFQLEKNGAGWNVCLNNFH